MSEKLLTFAAMRGVAVPPPPHTPGLLGRLAASVFLHPVRNTRRMPRELAYLEGARRLALRTSAGELTGWEWGDPGRPAVGLVHGWEGHGAQLGAFAAPLVAAGFRVLSFDAPAHGESPGDECSAPLLGRLLVELEPAHGPWFAFVAHSMGAAGAAMAATHGSRPRGLVFLAPPLSQEERVSRMAERAQLSPEAAAVFRAEIARRTGMPDVETNMLSAARHAGCPMLAFHDPDDQEASFAATQSIVAHWPGARVVPCPGRGHYRLLSTPEVVRQAVEFIAGLR